ncbi:hypothetical protein BWQ96_03710 [Gracilariopsis chorda]|uniref:BAR domain-containing protein n=1 Tax=Gracilariopsis chorda TaxID=448386 RepID=A0A2V3IWK4_9FLOR|nr:hypothetical protein BWQ96_03710 [Gracilariopsis chorda]|eukprot:PXF46475.1 hypothetical protein BWQ96_03710 [Gracilariopsis chorda]
MEKKALLREKASLKRALEFLHTGKAAWTQVTKTQLDFNEHILAESDMSSIVHEVAKKEANSMRNLHSEAHDAFLSKSPSLVVDKEVREYLKELEDIEKHFKDVEASFSEVMRYEKKVDKLKSKSKTGEKIKRNIDKMAANRAEHDAKLNSVVPKMKAARERFDSMLGKVQYTFWMSQDKYSQLVNPHTESMTHAVAAAKDENTALAVSE